MQIQAVESICRFTVIKKRDQEIVAEPTTGM